MNTSSAIGVFGGTFDPIHIGHLRLACAFRDELGLHEVRLIPTGEPPHRQRPYLPATVRLALVQAAVRDHTGLVADEREVRRHGYCYTVDTLREIRQQIGPTRPLYLLIGGDSLLHLHTWREWQQLFALAHLVVATRPGFAMADLAPEVQHFWQTRQADDFAKQSAAGTIRTLSLAPLDVSATQIRAKLQANEDVSALLPPAVREPLMTYLHCKKTQ